MLAVLDGPPPWVIHAYATGMALVKVAQDEIEPPEASYAMAGTLYLSKSGYLMLSVPNAFVRGVFSALVEPGIELPPSGPSGGLEAHVSVMRQEELDAIGGADKVTERGKQFRYSLGRLQSVNPDGWAKMSKVWFVGVHSPELMSLRRSYGLSSLPDGGKKAFHITCAVKRRGVLARNETSKAAA